MVVQRTFANLEEDVETEDAWEIASRRASIISRRPSNHSIRFPYLNEAPADVQSSTNIGFGLASASVDELLGGESGTASEEGGMLGSAPLARQVTAVQETGFTDGGDVDMPEAVREEEEYGDGISPGLGLGDDPDCFSSLAVLTDPSMLDRQYSNPSSGPSSGIPIASASESTHASGFGSLETQTPMNYTFLSTMANGGPDRHVNFAPHANGTGSRRHGTLVEEEEGNGAGGRQGAMIIEAQSGRELRGSRGDTDMMFA